MQNHHQPDERDDEEDFAPDAVIDAYMKDVHRTLIREQLRRSVDVRVRNMIAALRGSSAQGRAVVRLT